MRNFKTMTLPELAAMRDKMHARITKADKYQRRSSLYRRWISVRNSCTDEIVSRALNQLKTGQ